MIRQRRTAGWIGITAGPILVAIGWLLWTAVTKAEPVLSYVFGSLFALCGGLAGARGIYILIKPLTALAIDRRGVTVGSGRAADLVLWSDLRGAHRAVVESGGAGGKPGVAFSIIALELVDPRTFYVRLDADKPRWLGRDTGWRPDHYPVHCTNLDADSSKLLHIFDEGIRRWGQLKPDIAPQTVYYATFRRSPHRRELAIVVALVFALCAAPFVLLRTPSWLEAAANCEVRNLYDGKQWRRARKTTVSWTGPCLDGRAQGRGILEWFRDSTRTVHYVGEMTGGRMTGHGESTERGIRYNGAWKDGELQDGTAIYPDGRRFEGRWYKGRWTKGVLTASGGRRLEGRWYEGRLTGKSVAEGPEGRYEGNWAYGVPEGTGTFVTADGRRYDGKWRDGKPVDPELARLQALQGWDCLWDIASRRFGDGFSGVGSARCRDK